MVDVSAVIVLFLFILEVIEVVCCCKESFINCSIFFQVKIYKLYTLIFVEKQPYEIQKKPEVCLEFFASQRGHTPHTSFWFL